MDGCGVLLGDAANPMVPFFGDVIDFGFEDCRLLARTFDKHKNENYSEILAEYSREKLKHTHALTELAMLNYKQVRSINKTMPYFYLKGCNNYSCTIHHQHFWLE